ncbi:MAG: 3-isopropylmalate dehydratase small subunit [bacterium]
MNKSIVLRVGDDIDTDVIIPAQYCVSSDPAFLGKHILEGLSRDFPQKIQPGRTVLVAGKNFGCGSSREQAPLAIKGAGVVAVIACSFARIFYRNAINIGLPILVSPEASADLQDGEEITIDYYAGSIINLSRSTKYSFAPFPPFIQEIIDSGGLVAYVRKKKNLLP